MATDFVLKIDGINGESSRKGYEKQIDVYSWSWGMDQTGSFHIGSGGAAGKVTIQDLEVTKYVDVSTPDLMVNCAKGQHIKSVTLSCLKAGGNESLPYIVIKLTDVIVTSVQPVGQPGAERIMERVRLNFAKCELTYTQQSATGGTEAAPKFGWDIQKNIAA